MKYFIVFDKIKYKIDNILVTQNCEPTGLGLTNLGVINVRTATIGEGRAR